MPSNLRSKIHSGPLNRSCVSVAAIGMTHSGKEAVTAAPSRRASSPAATCETREYSLTHIFNVANRTLTILPNDTITARMTATV